MSTGGRWSSDGRWLGAVLCLAVLAAACGGNPSAAPSAAPGTAASPAAAAPQELVVSYSNLTPDVWPLWLANDQGLFGRHGLQVDLRLIESSTGVAALLSGEVPAAVLGGSEVLAAAAEGADLSIVGGLTRGISFRFMAPARIRGPEDLRGQRVGVSRFGSSSDIASRLALQRLGLTPGQDVEIVQVGSLTARLQALESGAIQGAVAQPPDTTRLTKQGNHVLFDVSDLGLPAASAVVAVRRADLAARRAPLQALMDALVEAVALMRRDPAASQAALARWIKQDDPEALEDAWSFYVQKVIPPTPRFETDQLEAARALLVGQSERLAGYDTSQLVDNSLVDDAVARGLSAP